MKILWFLTGWVSAFCFMVDHETVLYVLGEILAIGFVLASIYYSWKWLTWLDNFINDNKGDKNETATNTKCSNINRVG